MQLRPDELELAYNALLVHERELRHEMKDFYEEDFEWQTINTELNFINNLINKIDTILDLENKK